LCRGPQPSSRPPLLLQPAGRIGPRRGLYAVGSLLLIRDCYPRCQRVRRSRFRCSRFRWSASGGS